MRKYLILSVATMLALAACTKERTSGVEMQDEIGFQVASYVQTKADGETAGNQPAAATPGKFTHEDFSAYAWHNNPDGTTSPRFSNEKVAQNDKGVWTTVNATYYWMKTGSDDFVCYAPFGEGSPEVLPTSITWGKADPWYQVKMDNKDLMYADKALNQTGVKAGSTVATPVPALFHHALAKLSFRVKANFVTDDAQTTTWEVTLRSAKLSGIRTKGTLALALPAGSTDGKWTLPTERVTWTENDVPKSQEVHVWSIPEAAMGSVLEPIELVSSREGIKLTTEEQDLYLDKDGKPQSFYVLPQALMTSGQDFVAQQLTVDFRIKTTIYYPENKEERVFQEDYVNTIDPIDISSLKAWQMGQDIRYTIRIKPTHIEDPNTPDTPNDVTVTFDPALVGWEPATAELDIQL